MRKSLIISSKNMSYVHLRHLQLWTCVSFKRCTSWKCRDKIREQKMEVTYNLKKKELTQELGIEQLVIYLLHKNEGLSLIPRNHIKIQGIVLCIYSSSDSDAQIPKAPWSLYQWVPGPMRCVVSPINVDSDLSEALRVMSTHQKNDSLMEAKPTGSLILETIAYIC